MIPFVSSTPWLGTLGQASLSGAVVIFLALIVSRLLHRLPGTARSWVWRLVFVKLLLGLLWTAPVLLRVLPAPAVRTASAPTGGSSTASYSLPGAPPAQPRLAAPSTPAPAESGRSGLVRPNGPIQSWSGTLLLFWLLGVGLFSVRVVRGVRETARLRRDAAPLDDPAVQRVLHSLCRDAGMRRVPALLRSDATAGPVLLGLRTPAIILPAVLAAQWSADELRPILAHELAHVRRADLAWQWFTLVVRGLFFFHPLVWQADAELRQAQEAACDADAIRSAETDPAEYGRMLVHVAGLSRSHAGPLVATLGVAEGFHSLERRLMAMRHLEFRSRAWAAAGMIVVGAFLAGLAPWQLAARAAQIQEKPARPGENNPLFSFERSNEGWRSGDARSQVTLTAGQGDVRWGHGALEWIYEPGQGMNMLSRPAPELHSGARTLDFWLKSSAPGAFQLYLVENDGSVYHMHFRAPGNEWAHYQAALSDLVLGEMTDENGRPDLGQVREIVIQDLSRYHTVPGIGALHTRKVWLDNLTFTDERVPARRVRRTVGGQTEVLFDDFSDPQLGWAARTGNDLRLEQMDGRSVLRARYKQGTSSADPFRIANHFDPRYRDMRAVKVAGRADHATRLRISLREFNGGYTGPEYEAFAELPAGAEWRTLTVPISEFRLTGGAGRPNLRRVWLLQVEDATQQPGARDTELDLDSISAVLTQ